MRSQRSTTFNLTSIQSQRAINSARKSFNGRSEKTKALGAVPDQENRLKNQVREYTIKNQKLSEFIYHFENSATDLNERDNLIKDLQSILISHTFSLERRMKRIDDLEKQVSIFRKPSNEDELFDKQFPIKLPDDSCRIHSARNNRRRNDFLPPPKYQKPKRRIFPPPKIEKPQEKQSADALNLNPLPEYNTNQTNIAKEREKLIQKTLYLDRLISIQKLKLKLYHDHRKLSELKNELDMIQSENWNTISFKKNEAEVDDENDSQNGDFYEEDDTDLDSLKSSISLIEERIQNEKNRISMYQDKYYPIHDAAIDIQRVWRGFMLRKFLKESSLENKNNNEENNEAGKVEQQEDNNANVDANIDVNNDEAAN
ncbi:hypothetical protein M9Y10_043284 [Tritrichomonas musculus]|uniref:IQ calmodulin-binding motif family protein n=1 Tax=Tritrichomonas musculus TaxID=1915356 RepID=A0ABR2K0A7_9EUKA